MFSKVKDWLMGVLVKKYALGPLVAVWDKADGYRTQLQLAAGSLVLGLGFFGILELEQSFTIATAIGGSAMATFMEKLRKKKGLVIKVQDAIKDSKK